MTVDYPWATVAMATGPFCYGAFTCRREKKENCTKEPVPAYILSVFLLKTYELFQTQRKWTCGYNEISMIFPKLLWFFFFPTDFSRPGNNHFKIPGLFQVFHDRRDPELRLNMRTGPPSYNMNYALSKQMLVIRHPEGRVDWLRRTDSNVGNQ